MINLFVGVERVTDCAVTVGASNLKKSSVFLLLEDVDYCETQSKFVVICVWTQGAIFIFFIPFFKIPFYQALLQSLAWIGW